MLVYDKRLGKWRCSRCGQEVNNSRVIPTISKAKRILNLMCGDCGEELGTWFIFEVM